MQFKEAVEQISSRIDIVDLISEHVVLRKAGSNFQGLCPFHQEKSPSFSVNQSKQIFKCFGCGAGGNAFEFYKKYHNLEFKDAVKELAQKVGIEIDSGNYNKEEYDKKEQLKKTIYEIYNTALEFYLWNLKHNEFGSEAQAYLKTRKLHPVMIERFMLGYSQNSWDSLYRFLQKKGFETEVIKESGLVIPKSDGGYYDRFRNRVIFPIHNENDQVIAFGGRTLGNDNAKYINSPETPIYTKGNNLYALNIAKNKIKEFDYVILVEGYLDTISCHEAGFENTVASLGTALTPEQSKKILRYNSSKKVIIAYDSDKAGQKAAERGIEVLEEVSKGTGINLYILQVPSGKDPDDFVHTEGAEAFKKVVEKASPIIEFQIENALRGNISNFEEKAKAIDKCIQVLLKIQNEIYVSDLIKKIVGWNENGVKLDIREEDLRRRLKAFSFKNNKEYLKPNNNNFNPNYKSQNFKNNTNTANNKSFNKFNKNSFNAQPVAYSDPSVFEYDKQSKALLAERGLIYFLMERYKATNYIKEKLENVVFQHPMNESIKNKIFESSSVENPLKWNELLAFFSESEYQKVIVEIWEDFDSLDISSDRILKDFLKQVKISFYTIQRDELKIDLDMAMKSAEKEIVKSLMEAYLDLQKKLKKLESEVYASS